jgi:phage terminase large subunit
MQIPLLNDLLEPFVPIIEGKKRYNLIYGGRAGGRSYFASQYIISKLFSDTYFRCGIMRLVQGDIRNSIYQEIIDRIEESEVNDPALEVREHLLTINFKNNTDNGIGFRKSRGDQKAKLKSLAGYTDIIIEEAEEISEEDFIQLDDSLRTVKADVRIFLLFNMPPKNNWMVKRWFNLVDSGIEGFYLAEPKESEKHNTEYVFSYWKNNEINLNQTTIDNFQRYKDTKPDHYWNMIMGLVPSGKRGVIFKDWKPISRKDYDELEYKPYYSGDFGFTNDPTALVEIKEHNNKVYVKELIYETGLINRRISERMAQMELNRSSEQIWDSAEPKSIAELRVENWNAIPSEKGAGSRRARIDYLLGKEVYYVEGSENIVNEVQNYCWALDKNKEPTNEPADGNDHLMDALSGGVYTKSKQPYIGF